MCVCVRQRTVRGQLAAISRSASPLKRLLQSDRSRWRSTGHDVAMLRKDESARAAHQCCRASVSSAENELKT
eukprot:6217176-Pyramimonas_sp.AAC.1